MFEQEGSAERVGGMAFEHKGGTFQYVRGNYKSLRGTNMTVVVRKHPHIYLICLVMSTIIKIKIRSNSCEIECFVETHLCKLCVILRSRVRITGCVSSLRISVGDSPCNYSVATYQGQQGDDVSQSVHGNYKTRF